MSLPISEEVVTQAGTLFKVWSRNSGTHIDCSVDLVDVDYDENNEDHVKYHKRNFHVAVPVAEIHHNSVVTAIKTGEDI